MTAAETTELLLILKGRCFALERLVTDLLCELPRERALALIGRELKLTDKMRSAATNPADKLVAQTANESLTLALMTVERVP